MTVSARVFMRGTVLVPIGGTTRFGPGGTVRGIWGDHRNPIIPHLLEVDGTLRSANEGRAADDRRRVGVPVNACAPTPNPVLARAHFEMLHELAAASGIDGVMVLCSYGENPTTGAELKPRVPHFAIGDVEGMTEAALGLCQQQGMNVYAPWAILRKDIPTGSRGTKNDVLATLALVVDADTDVGKAGIAALPMAAPYVIETSRGNTQPIYPLARALPPQEAEPLAAALLAAVGGDEGTGDTAHVWRISGTLNWPGRRRIPVAARPRRSPSWWWCRGPASWSTATP